MYEKSDDFANYDNPSDMDVLLNCIIHTVRRLISCFTRCIFFLYSLPNQVCTVLSDADCISPVQTLCSAVTPTPECQMVLRQFFNDSGTFCINVSLTNDVSLAVTSAKVSVTVGEYIHLAVIRRHLDWKTRQKQDTKLKTHVFAV